MPVQVLPISAECIGNGLFLQKLNETIQHVANDVIDDKRKFIDKPRTIKAEITITPMQDGYDGANSPKIKWKVNSTVPGIEGSESIGIVQDGEIVVNYDDSIIIAANQQQMKLVNLP